MTKRYIPLCLLAVLMLGSCDSNDAAPTTGTGGSMARFTISGDHLYIVDRNRLHAYNIQTPGNLQPVSTVTIGEGIETIFPYNQHLFIGSQTGMLIYSLADPANPQYVSNYTHVQSCDPVVVQGDYAYVTLREATDCRNGQNLLDVVNIRDLQQPYVVNSLPMKNPHGLGIDGNRLFVCEGDYGLKVFDVTNPEFPAERQFIENVRTYDVIPRNHVLLVTGKDGLSQYRYSDSTQLQLLSTLPIAVQ